MKKRNHTERPYRTHPSAPSSSEKSRSRRPLFLALGTLAITGALAGCGQMTAPPPPALHLNALTVGEVGGKVIDNLQNTSLEKYSGTQDLSKYDLVVVDGDTSDAAAIKTHPLVKQALALHKPMLFVDVMEDHKQNGIAKLIGFGTRGASDGYLVVPVVQPSGKTFYHMYITSTPSQLLTGATGSGSLGASGPTDTMRSTAADDQAFAASLARNIKAAQAPALKVQDANTSIQPVQQQWAVTDTFPMNPPTTGMGVTTPQTGMAAVTVTYTLFQDLSTNVANGGTQDLVITTDASGDPGTMVASNDDEMAWFMGAVNIWDEFTTPSGDNGGLTFYKAGPIAENQSNTYESGTSFEVGLGKEGPSGGFTWDSTQSHEIPDWSVTANYGLSNKTQWRFWSSSPNVDDNCVYNFKCSFWDGKGAVRPNALSTSLSQYHTESVYHNNTLSSATINLESDVVFWLYDNYHKSGKFPKATFPAGRGYPVSIDLSSVIPQQPTITYNYATAPTNSTARGTVMLPKPATGDQTVYLKAVGTSNTGIAIPDHVVIPAGSSSADFPISINNDQSTTSVTVQANYGQYSTQALLPVKETSFTPPANNLTFDSQNWSETVSDAPATSGWKTGQLVRYAVAYVDASGHETAGPYSTWIAYGPWAMPSLTNLPTGPSGTVARKVYRQFLSEVQNGTPGHVIKPDANGNSIPNNTDTNFRDDTW